MAETTTTTRSFFAVRPTMFAHWRKRSALPTEVPPNFITSRRLLLILVSPTSVTLLPISPPAEPAHGLRRRHCYQPLYRELRFACPLRQRSSATLLLSVF